MGHFECPTGVPRVGQLADSARGQHLGRVDSGHSRWDTRGPASRPQRHVDGLLTGPQALVGKQYQRAGGAVRRGRAGRRAPVCGGERHAAGTVGDRLKRPPTRRQHTIPVMERILLRGCSFPGAPYFVRAVPAPRHPGFGPRPPAARAPRRIRGTNDRRRRTRTASLRRATAPCDDWLWRYHAWLRAAGVHELSRTEGASFLVQGPTMPIVCWA